MRVAIIQARMGSTRLPGKVLLDIAGRTMLERVVERSRRIELLDDVVVATTSSPADDVIVGLAQAAGWSCFRGSEDDVLERYLGAARAFRATTVLRITSDCPLLDPAVSSEVLRVLERSGADYCSNVRRRTFPRGLDTEALTYAALERAAREAQLPVEREHVTPYVHGHPERFRLEGVEADGDFSAHRWTVDTPEDLQLVRRIYEELGPDGPRSWREVVDLMNAQPDLALVNAHIRQKP